LIGTSGTSALTAEEGARSSAALADRLLNCVLFVTILASSFVFVEPSPHDALVFVLLLACITAHIRFDRKLVPLLLLLIVYMIGGSMSLIQVGNEEKDIQYIGTSLYLCIATLTFAFVFSDGNLVRLAILRRAYLLAALMATAAGYIGYFHLLPGADVFLDVTDTGGTIFARVSATFKDPNVFGPFLVFPLLMLIIGFLTRGVRLLSVIVTAVLLGGLFLSFSRGAWIHFLVSAAVCVILLFASTRVPAERTRMIVLVAAAAIAMALFLIAMLSVDSIRDMFIDRAKLFQPYDVGPGGRFTLQRLAVGMVLAHPNGLGPFEFARIFGTQQHNQYLQAFLVYGWLGGAAYLALVVITLVVGLRYAQIAAPWQHYLIAAYAVFVGEVGEGTIVDTDHWRHFFLMLGMIWGLTVATINYHRRLRL
jgi:O-antigen ligase